MYSVTEKFIGVLLLFRALAFVVSKVRRFSGLREHLAPKEASTSLVRSKAFA